MEPWGTQVTAVEIKDIVLPDNMQRAMAKEAEAERERRAKRNTKPR
jgi:regulator of protease activity HflC (stomatin/prohibitin superfamily)